MTNIIWDIGDPSNGLMYTLVNLLALFGMSQNVTILIE